MLPTGSARDIVRAYHRRTKHRFDAYAAGPETLDWDAQPAPFRHFEGALEIVLPTLAQAMQLPPLAAAMRRPLSALDQSSPPVPMGLQMLGAWLQLSLGITAWKTYGPDRWAVRANPSSGNLHPVEAYLFVHDIDGLADGLYHYCPDRHSLEYRAGFDTSNGPPQLLVALSSVMWREAWKYGERAFRYCQLDVGHAVGALRYAAAVMGWPLAEQFPVAADQLAHWLGLDREADFTSGRYPHTEREEAEILLALTSPTDLAWLQQAIGNAHWHGQASAIDRHPMYRWSVIDEVAEASRHQVDSVRAEPVEAPSAARPVHSERLNLHQANLMPAAAVMLQRRSAQRFDHGHVMPQQDFFALLAATLPNAPLPWSVLAAPPRIALMLFVHRVQGLAPGLYLLPRTSRLSALLPSKPGAGFMCEAVPDAPTALGLLRLSPVDPSELQRISRSLHCHQDIASNSCFALGMLAEFDTAIAEASSGYRDLLREAGLIGQVLYLHAEAMGLRGTGIGCYFDDPVHTLLGLPDERVQSLYHFTVGLPLDDPRITTTLTSSLEPFS